MKKQLITFSLLVAILLCAWWFVTLSKSRNSSESSGQSSLLEHASDRLENEKSKEDLARRFDGVHVVEIDGVHVVNYDPSPDFVSTFLSEILSLSLGDLGEKDREIAMLVRSDLSKAVLFAEEIPPGHKRSLYLRMLSSEVPDSMARNFVEMVLRLPLEQDRSAIGNLLNSTSRPFDPGEAIRVANGLQNPSEPAVIKLLSYAAILVGEESTIGEAFQTALEVPLQYRPGFRKQVLLAKISSDPASSLEPVLEAFSGSEDNEEGISKGGKEEIVRQLSTKLGGRGVDQVNSVSIRTGDYGLVREYLSAWARSDSMEAGKWVLNLPEGETKNLGRKVVAEYLSSIGQDDLAKEWR